MGREREREIGPSEKAFERALRPFPPTRARQAVASPSPPRRAGSNPAVQKISVKKILGHKKRDEFLSAFFCRFSIPRRRRLRQWRQWWQRRRASNISQSLAHGRRVRDGRTCLSLSLLLKPLPRDIVTVNSVCESKFGRRRQIVRRKKVSTVRQRDIHSDPLRACCTRVRTHAASHGLTSVDSSLYAYAIGNYTYACSKRLLIAYARSHFGSHLVRL